MATAIDFAALLREERAKAIAENRLKAQSADEKASQASGTAIANHSHSEVGYLEDE
jgi:hypothetical protein